MTQSSVNNVRVRRTRTLLREALIALIEERGFEALTVGALTERAMVSRAAFYRSYRDKYDLVEEIFEEAMDALMGAVGELGPAHPAEVWVRFFEHIAQYERLYRALLGKRGSPWFVEKMRAGLLDLIQRRGALEDGATAAAHRFPDTFVPQMVSAMFVEAIGWWLEHGRPHPPREMATRTALLASAVFQAGHASE